MDATIDIHASDLHRSLAFYRAVTGAPTSWRHGATATVRLGALRLRLSPEPGGTTRLRLHPRLTAAQLQARLTRAGFAAPNLHADEFDLTDPAGNRVAVVPLPPPLCERDPCPWSASVFHVIVAHRAETPEGAER